MWPRVLLLVLLTAPPAAGEAVIQDGERIRLLGINAPEPDQQRRMDSHTHDCGEASGAAANVVSRAR